MRSSRSINELPGDAYPAGRPAHAAFEQIAHPELATDLLHIHSPALVDEARIAGDDKQPAHSRNCRDDIFDYAVGEVSLIGVAAHVLEGQDGNRRLIGNCERQRMPAVSAFRRQRRGCGPTIPRCLLFPDVADEAEAFTCNGTDQRLSLPAVADRAARCIDLAVHRRFGNNSTSPDCFEQIILADHTLAVPYQVDQQVEDLRSHRNQLGPAPQLTPFYVEDMVCEQKPHLGLLSVVLSRAEANATVPSSDSARLAFKSLKTRQSCASWPEI